LETAGEILIEVGHAVFTGAQERPRRNHHPLAAAAGYFLLGAILGALSAWLLPQPVLSPFLFPGLSVIVAPVGAGFAMAIWGEYRRAKGHPTTNLATWFGGAALALGLSLARFLGLQ
jgi:hypothetical protein